jgi:beta-N-acetylhexosaminidase
MRPSLGTCLVAGLVGTVVVVPAQPAVAAAPTGFNAASVLARMTPAQRVGQLVMVSAALSGVTQASKDAVTRYHVGSVFLSGRSSAGVSSVRSMTTNLQSLATPAATAGVPLLVAVDQEGGFVQSLSGSGFSTIPTALKQGGFSAATLRRDAGIWGRQLASAGVNLNLAPVLDTVPSGRTSTNQPIGRYAREYGTKPATVTTAGINVIRGMHAAGVATAVKHFPGLGRASGNTDTTFGVKDTVTTRHDAYIAPYAAGTGQADAEVVMVSLATYTRIDASHRAVFSPTVLHGMLRHDLGFTGVIMTDSIDAQALKDLTPAQRAIDFIAAGGDLVLTTRPSDVASMVPAMLSKAKSDSSFRAKVDASALRVLVAKQRRGVLTGGVAAAANGNRLFVAEQTAGHAINLYTRTSGTWSGPVEIGKNAARTPALTALPGTAGVEVAKVTDARRVAIASYRPGQTSLSWQHLGGTPTSAPAVAAAGGGRLDVAVRNGSWGLSVRDYRPGAGWSGWTSLGGAFADAAPALVYQPSGDLAAFALAQTQVVYRNIRHNGGWSGWTSLGTVGDSGLASAVNAATGTVGLFARGRNEALLERKVGSTTWPVVGGIRPVANPTAARTSGTTTTVIAEGRDGRLHIADRTSSGWGAWSTLPFD